jgi:hypothetical protein
LTDRTGITWSAFYNWEQPNRYPAYAGRYFDSSSSWTPGEFASAKSATGGVLNKIVPLQAGNASREQQAGSIGHGYGDSDARATCQQIVNALNAGVLAIPPSRQIYVYLDVEANTALSVDYWAGWATAVYHYPAGSTYPFWPCIYGHYTKDPSNGRYSPDVAAALNSSYSNYPSDPTRCFGLWSSEPEPCSYCNPNASPDWSVFNPFSQSYGETAYPVPLLLYQFAEHGILAQNSGCVYYCGRQDYAGGQNLDLDSDNSGNSGAQNYMLLIP